MRYQDGLSTQQIEPHNTERLMSIIPSCLPHSMVFRRISIQFTSVAEISQSFVGYVDLFAQ